LSTRAQKSHRARNARLAWSWRPTLRPSYPPVRIEVLLELERFYFPAVTVSYERSPVLLARGVRRPTHMQMTQIPQRRPILVAHPLGEPRIIQPLISR
jgi:hypothetical protein